MCGCVHVDVYVRVCVQGCVCLASMDVCICACVSLSLTGLRLNLPIVFECRFVGNFGRIWSTSINIRYRQREWERVNKQRNRCEVFQEVGGHHDYFSCLSESDFSEGLLLYLVTISLGIAMK